MLRCILKPIPKKKTNWSVAFYLFGEYVFWAIFKQNGTALTRWANYYTDRSVPASFEKPLENIYMVDGKDFKDKEVSVYDNQYQTQKDADGKT
jgi:POT family proton-dependent oligopeptide transporter